MKLAVVLFNLGGPDSPEAVEPFLQNLFSDPAVLGVPSFIRQPFAKFIAARRAPVAREIYAKIGGRSPILQETQVQARALEAALTRDNVVARAFIVMRCWNPRSDETAKAIAEWRPDKIVLLPLYPQFSTTTTASSLRDWAAAAGRRGLPEPDGLICCYPVEPGFVRAEADLITAALAKRRPDLEYRLLLSAHGLPKRVIARGDPYQSQVERTAAAITAQLGMAGEDWRVCYQSRVGPLAWIGPATDAEIRQAGADGKGLIVAPIAFVSEHSETLVELDIEYANLAKKSGVPDYIRVPTVGTHKAFVEGLASLVMNSLAGNEAAVSPDEQACAARFHCCGLRGRA